MKRKVVSYAPIFLSIGVNEMNIKKTLLVSVAFAMVASVSFAAKSDAEANASEIGRAHV